MKRRTIFGILAGLTITLVATAVAVESQSGHGRVMKRFVSAMIDDALDDASVTMDQRAAIHEVRDRVLAAVVGGGNALALSNWTWSSVGARSSMHPPLPWSARVLDAL